MTITSAANNTASSNRVVELEAELARLSHLYDTEVSTRTQWEDKALSAKRMAEERQIEAAALKYEYRKVQELKESLLAENAYLKAVIGSGNSVSSSSPLLNTGLQQQASTSSPVSTTSNNNSPSSSKISGNSPRVLSSCSASQLQG